MCSEWPKNSWTSWLTRHRLFTLMNHSFQITHDIVKCSFRRKEKTQASTERLHTPCPGEFDFIGALGFTFFLSRTPG